MTHSLYQLAPSLQISVRLLLCFPHSSAARLKLVGEFGGQRSNNCTSSASSIMENKAMSQPQAKASSAAKNNGFRVTWKGKQYIGVKEGLATILRPETQREQQSRENEKSSNQQKNPGKARAKAMNQDGSEVQQVFYNPIQQFNRDLTVLAIKVYGEEVVKKKQKQIEATLKKKHNKKNKRDDGPAAVAQELTNANEQRPSKVAKTASHGDATCPGGGGAEPMDIDEEEEQEQEQEQVEVEMGEEHEQENEAGAGKIVTGERLDGDGDGDGEVVADVSIAASKTTTAAALPLDSPEKPERPEKSEKSERQCPFRILDALSASGLRALRYAHELPFVTSVTANDLMASAVESIKTNIDFNGLADRVKVSHDDARGHMYKAVASALEEAAHKPRRTQGTCRAYDVIDLDPYGTAAPFLDAAVQAVHERGGLLCVTCTDSALFAGTGYPEKTYSQYGGVPLKGDYSHEVGLRLVLQAVAAAAARYGLAIDPLLSLSVDYYVRLFVRVRRAAADVKHLSAKTMLVYNCDSGCGAWVVQPLAKNKIAPNKKATGTFFKHSFALAPATADVVCEHCGCKMHLGGPMYGGPLHTPDFISDILALLPTLDRNVYGTLDRIEGVLRTALEEMLPARAAAGDENSAGHDDTLPLPPDFEQAVVDSYPFYFVPSSLARVLHCQTPPEDMVRGAMVHLGFRVTRSHCKPGSLKTDAPWHVIWHVMREWAHQKSPPRAENIRVGGPAWRLLGWDKKTTSGVAARGDVDGILDADSGQDTVLNEASQQQQQQQQQQQSLTADQETPTQQKQKLSKQADVNGRSITTTNKKAKKTANTDTLPPLVFDQDLERLGRQSKNNPSTGPRLVRFPMNPAPNWGPMNRAAGSRKT